MKKLLLAGALLLVLPSLASAQVVIITNGNGWGGPVGWGGPGYGPVGWGANCGWGSCGNWNSGGTVVVVPGGGWGGGVVRPPLPVPPVGYGYGYHSSVGYYNNGW